MVYLSKQLGSHNENMKSAIMTSLILFLKVESPIATGRWIHDYKLCLLLLGEGSGIDVYLASLCRFISKITIIFFVYRFFLPWKLMLTLDPQVGLITQRQGLSSLVLLTVWSEQFFVVAGCRVHSTGHLAVFLTSHWMPVVLL